MSKQDALWFGVVGAAVWAAATLFYAAFAGDLIEHAFWFYALNAVLAAGLVLGGFGILARARRIPRARRLRPAVAFSAPGLLGGALVMANFATLLPDLPPASLGRYGAFLVFAYVALLASALERPLESA